MSLPADIARCLRLPLIAAPMLRISGPDLVEAACLSGVIGSFPTINARTSDELDAWLRRIADTCARAERPSAPVCPNVIMRRAPELLKADVDVLVRNKVRLVLASVGSPANIIGPLHDIGCTVLADVATVRHAEKALQAGADGLVLLSAGAGGQTGWVNGMAFTRAVRAMFDGPLVLSGGVSDGVALWASRVMGCDLAMMGTRFIATTESLATPPYRQMLVDSRLDDIMLTQALTGLQTNMLRPSIVAAGLDPESLAGPVPPERARELFSEKSKNVGPKRWVDIWSAGHTVSGVREVLPVAALVDELAAEYQAARRETQALLAEDD